MYIKTIRLQHVQPFFLFLPFISLFSNYFFSLQAYFLRSHFYYWNNWTSLSCRCVPCTKWCRIWIHFYYWNNWTSLSCRCVPCTKWCRIWIMLLFVSCGYKLSCSGALQSATVWSIFVKCSSVLQKEVELYFSVLLTESKFCFSSAQFYWNVVFLLWLPW